jgi:integrase
MTTLTEQVQDYLTIRRALGFGLIADERVLRRFVADLDARGHRRLTVDAALVWATSPAGTPLRVAARRLSMIRQFALHLSAVEPGTEIPPTRLVGVHATRPAPCIFTAAQVQDLMGGASRLPSPVLAASFTTLIGLMAATGLRTSEALALDDGDVDLPAGRLLVESSKFGKTRQVPLDPTVVTALGRYQRRRNQLCPHRSSLSFLLAPGGDRLGGYLVSDTFRALLTDAAITVPAWRRQPVLHDLRHTFAVNTLREWHADGVDVERRLPVLSTYLGHLNPANTYWYLQAVPELMSVVADRLEAFQSGQS